MSLVIYRHALLLATLKTLGVIRVGMLSAGLAALAAILATWTITIGGGGTRPAWAGSIRMFALGIAFTFLAAAISASAFMPRTADITRPTSEDGHASGSAVVPLLLALAAVAVLQAPSVAAWWAEDRALLIQAAGDTPDPLGLSLIPRVILHSLPALAAVTLLSFVLTSILGTIVRAELAFRVLGACAVLQAGLVAGEQLVLQAVRALGTSIQDLIAAASDPNASAQVSDWLARHDAAGADVSWRLVWILGGYFVAVAATALVSPRRQRVHATSVAGDGVPEAPALPAAAIVLPTRAALLRRLGTLKVAPSAVEGRQATGGPASSAATFFDYSHYEVEPRWTLLESVLRHYSIYDIQSIPPMSRARFSFSWKTGILRREPDGPDLLELTRAERHGVFAGRSHLVMDLVTGVPLGTLRPSAPGWEILDAAGTPFARVFEEKAGGLLRYVATVREQAVCRFTWAMQGLTVASAVLDVEFLPGSDGCFDRALAMALAPIVERKARIASERRR